MKGIVILGAAENGVGAAILTQKEGFDVFISDVGEIKDKYKKTPDEHNIRWEEKHHIPELILNAGKVIKSPGIPKEAPMVQKAMARGIGIISKIEFTGHYAHSKMTCITDSNGKTVTMSLIYHIFKSASYDAGLAGNIGRSLALQMAEDPHEYYIIELNSSRLDDIYKFETDIAILLDIAPDHLDHCDNCIQNYVDAKMRIIQSRTAQDSFIYWNDDPIIERELKKYDIRTVQCPFSGLREKGLVKYIEEGECTVEKPTPFNMEQEALALTGRHDIYNSLAANIATDIAGIRSEVIRKNFGDFPGAEHRLGKMCKVGDIQYISDSKATSVGACWYALESMRTLTILILGGKDRGNDYGPIKDLVKEKYIALMYLRADNNKLHDSFDNLDIPVRDTHSMKECVATCYELAKPSDTVPLSPCCASFDLFKNMEDRGDQFRTLVRSL